MSTPSAIEDELALVAGGTPESAIRAVVLVPSSALAGAAAVAATHTVDGRPPNEGLPTANEYEDGNFATAASKTTASTIGRADSRRLAVHVA
jgi:sugar phosphate permease